MTSHGFLSSLSMMTLIAAVVVVGVAFLYFMRRRSNRHPLEGKQERNIAKDIDEGRSAPDRSPPE